MYLSPALEGHGEPSLGAPTLCRHGTNSPSSPSASSAPAPMRVMIRIETATYAESVSCTPIWAIGEPSGPMLKGTTYMVWPRMEPRKRSVSVSRISLGSRQLLVGPASSSRSEQMNVRSSTRATSPGSERARYELGRLASDNRVNVPASTSCCARASYSSAEPSHQWIESGSVRAATSSTQAASRACFVGTVISLIASAPYSTLPSAVSAGPGWRFGTRTTRLNSATRTPSWLCTRVWTLTVPRSGLDWDSRFSSTSDSTKSVSPWKTGAGCLSSSVARLAIALPETSETLIPSARLYTSGPTTTLRPCWEAF